LDKVILKIKTKIERITNRNISQTIELPTNIIGSIIITPNEDVEVLTKALSVSINRLEEMAQGLNYDKTLESIADILSGEGGMK
jgi:hypothetical protein